MNITEEADFWTDFCGSRLWNSNQTWDTDDPDFTPCFHRTILVYVPAACLILLTPLELLANIRSRCRFIPWSWINVAKLTCTSLLALIAGLQIIHLVLMDAFGSGSYFDADLANSVIKLVIFLLNLVLILAAKRAGRINSPTQWFFWLVLAVCQSFTLASVLGQDAAAYASTIIAILSYSLILANLVLNSIADKPPIYKHISFDLSANDGVGESPEQNSSFLSQLLFAWFEPAVWKARTRTLTMKDLWYLNPEDSVKTIVPMWNRLWWGSEEPEEEKMVPPRKAAKKSLLLVIVRAYGGSFVKGGLWQMLFVILQFVSPLMLNQIIAFLQNDDEPLWRGYLYVVILATSALVAATADSTYWNKMNMIGLRLKTALVTAIYRKSLSLSISSKRQTAAGEVVNLVSVDCQKIKDACVFVNILWSCLVQVGLSLFLLYSILGVAVFVGLAVLLILFPVNAIVWAIMSRYQRSQMEKKDQRVRLITEILAGIRVLKFNCWEESFRQRIGELRDQEVQQLRIFQFLEGSQYFVWSSAPFLVALASFTAYILMDPVNNVLDARVAFVSLTLFNTMRGPLFLLPFGIVSVIQAIVSIRRINDFLLLQDIQANSVSHVVDEKEGPICLRNASFKWESSDEAPVILRQVSLSVGQGSLVAVVGRVGSGKSSLMSAVLCEMFRFEGTANIYGKLAYVPQQAWIQNQTLRDNILFGRPFNQELYDQVIDACALTLDLHILPGGHDTEIGERGANLSGGQKQRVSLARAVYNEADIYLLDDPLSALDPHVGEHIFERVIGPNGMLKHKTRILITHAIQFLPAVDSVVVMKDGRISETGTYHELLQTEGDFALFLREQNELGQRAQKRKFSRPEESADEEESLSEEAEEDDGSKSDDWKPGRQLIEEEHYELQGVSWDVYLYYAKNVGTFMCLASVGSYLLFQLFTIMANIWLAVWSGDEEAASSPASRNFYLAIYGVLGLLQSLSVLLASILVTLGTLNASIRLHSHLLARILNSTMYFFESTPIGRIVNRFSKDIDEVDLMIPTHIKDLLTDVFSVLGALIVICYASPVTIAVVIPVLCLFYFVQTNYLRLSRLLKRLISVTQSPINSSITESFNGAAVIRAFQHVKNFIQNNADLVELNQRCYYPEVASNSWLFHRLEILSDLLIIFTSVFSIYYRDSVDPGLVGLGLTYTFTFQLDVYLMTRYMAELEKSIVGVERIREYQEAPVEEDHQLGMDLTPLDPLWPNQGAIEFSHYSTRYREGMDLVLKDISFRVAPGQKVGVVGRTGAGKTSLTNALFRMIEAAEGAIFIDGVDIAQIRLPRLRSAITVIAQDPVLFSGTLRFNLDPLNEHSDDQLWTALQHSHIKTFVQALPLGLEHHTSEGGTNFSLGQRQMICLARALLRKTKILVLDEATAAVDLETDDLIQRTIREQFRKCTILTIAHRVKTVMDNDLILVLADGRILEFDTPANLMARSDSVFFSLTQRSGITLD